MKTIKRKQNDDQVEKEFIKCVNEVNITLEKYHIVVRIAALKRLISEDSKILIQDYIPEERKKESSTPRQYIKDNMFI
jgi:hypothetical protein